MRALRLLSLIVIGGLLVIGVLVDERDRPIDQLAPPVIVATPDSSAGTWFCAGGSGEIGPAAVGLEIVNAGGDNVAVEVIVIRDDADGRRTELTVPAGERTAVNLSQLAPEANWLGALVEADSDDIVVEQTFDGLSGTDRAPCSTTTGSALYAADGATRLLAEGEGMTLLLMNPFQDDAIANISFDADVGPDSLSAVVVPAQRIVAIDVTSEVTVASRIHTAVEVVAGRLVANRVQIRDGSLVRGLAVTPLVQAGAAVSVLPIVATEFGLFDRIHVTNPSDDVVAEVDLEIITDGSVTLDPIELTVRAGRTVVVDVASESRLAALPMFSVVAGSLTGDPVVVALERRTELDGDMVAGTAAMGAVDAAASEWIVARDGNVSDAVVVNPSSTAIATVEIWVVRTDGDERRSTFELGPGRRQPIATDELDPRDIVRVIASEPVVVGRAQEGFTSRQLLGGIAAGGVVPVGQVD